MVGASREAVAVEERTEGNVRNFQSRSSGGTTVNKPDQNLPKVVSQAEWQSARDALLAKEKAHTRARDALAAERRRLPMVKIDKDYVFEGSDGKARLIDLFDGRRQLILYHFMFGPTWGEGCDGCSWYAD